MMVIDLGVHSQTPACVRCSCTICLTAVCGCRSILQQHGTCTAWKLWNENPLSHVRPLLAAVTLSKLELLYNVVSLGYDAVWMDTDIVSPSVCALYHRPHPACQAGILAHGNISWACIRQAICA